MGREPGVIIKLEQASKLELININNFSLKLLVENFRRLKFAEVLCIEVEGEADVGLCYRNQTCSIRNLEKLKEYKRSS